LEISPSNSKSDCNTPILRSFESVIDLEIGFNGIVSLQNLLAGLEQTPPSRGQRHRGLPSIEQFDIEFRFDLRDAARLADCETDARCAPFVNPPASTTAIKWRI
jgi:hypothetical protein